MKKGRNCPNCEWKFPVFAPPVKRKEGSAFICPNCGVPLVYHTGLGREAKFLAGTIFALSLPVFVFMMNIDDNRTLQLQLLFPILIVGLVAFWYFINLEYLVRNKNSDD